MKITSSRKGFINYIRVFDYVINFVCALSN